MDDITAGPTGSNTTAGRNGSDSALDAEFKKLLAPGAPSMRTGEPGVDPLDRAEEMVLQFEAEAAAFLALPEFAPRGRLVFNSRIDALLVRVIRRMVWLGYSRQDAEDVSQEAAAMLYRELLVVDDDKYTLEQRFWFLWQKRALPNLGRKRASSAKKDDLARGIAEWGEQNKALVTTDPSAQNAEIRDLIAQAPLTDDEKWGLEQHVIYGLKPRDLVSLSQSSDSANTWSQRLVSGKRKLRKYVMEEAQNNDE